MIFWPVIARFSRPRAAPCGPVWPRTAPCGPVWPRAAPTRLRHVGQAAVLQRRHQARILLQAKRIELLRQRHQVLSDLGGAVTTATRSSTRSSTRINTTGHHRGSYEKHERKFGNIQEHLSGGTILHFYKNVIPQKKNGF